MVERQTQSMHSLSECRGLRAGFRPQLGRLLVDPGMEQAARREMREADELAKRYWEKRDGAKKMEEQAKALASEAASEARAAQKARVTAERLEKKVESAEERAQRALQIMP
ncbi:hypothetical protein COHA_008943 [Chlorella ohadii]|uniref:Uncharacterized protein n=1 Tax=Chlorella ohadii TaxID=2649997 RepID=A0AAD5H2R2_9CHLO|nr:hypothetical protein COHA_008943 [Chlorella ohadii]